MKCALEAEDARAYWAQVGDEHPTDLPRRAFDEYWFGARSLACVTELLANFKHRFAAYPDALDVLRRWPSMAPAIRKLIGHWHLQLSDPLYRTFTGRWLVDRRALWVPDVSHDAVVRFVAENGRPHWTPKSRIQFAGKLLGAAYSAGLVATNRDPRPLQFPCVPDDALSYLLHLLRGIAFDGTLLCNPYTASVGLGPDVIESRLRALPSLRFRRQGDLIDFGFVYPSLRAWADATVLDLPQAAASGVGR